MKLIQRITALVLALVLVAGLLPPTARAEESATPLLKLSLSHVNPLYAEVITEEDLASYSPPAVTTWDLNNPADTVEDAAAELREQMKYRENSIPIHIYVDTMDSAVLEELIMDIYYLSFVHTGVPTEGDYLRWQVGGFEVVDALIYQLQNQDGNIIEDLYVLEIPYAITFYTTAAQEEQMDSTVASLLAELNLSDKSDYEKIKGIYDYICANVRYDDANLDNEDYTLKYTAYAALINGTAVCQGYANLLYRLALELGVDSRLIPGDGGGPHGWNIVELDNLYYNADSTWDEGKTVYDYFLKCEANFPRHVRYEEWDTESFHAEYPMASSDYVPSEAPCQHTYFVTSEQAATCTAPGTRTYACSKCGDSYVDTYADALGHTEIIDEAVPATCVQTGLTEGSHCSVCNTVLIAQEVIPLTDHNWDAGTISKEPTEEETGIKLYLCTVCGETREEILPVLEHTHQYTPAVTPPTCADQGYTTYTCTCGDTYVDDIVEAPGHTYVTQEAVAATCTTDGLTEGKYCSVCNIVFAQQEVVPATGHSYQYGVCTVCGAEDPNYEEPAEPEEIARGTCGDNLTWVYETNNRLSIYGSGYMNDFVAGQTPWADYQSMIESVYTDKTVTSIGMNAFLDCSRLTAWYFEGNRTEFSDLLAEVRSGNEPLKAADYYWAVRGTCGENLTFEYDHDTHTLTISGNGAMTDYNVNSTASVQTPWFDNMQTIQRIIINEGVTSIGTFAFYDANDLVLVSLPSTLTSIGDSAFGFCISLQSIDIPDAVNVIGPGAFESCNSLLSIVIPDGVTELLNNVFKSCNSMTSITLPDSIRAFGGYTFSGCNVLANFTMPANLEETGEYTFQGCKALTHVTFPESFRSMGRYAFQEAGLTTMKFEGDAPYFGDEPFGRVTATVYYPAHNDTWTDAVRQNYGGTLTWNPFCPGEHTWDEGTVTNVPTPDQPGVMIYTCTICGETKTCSITNRAARISGADRYATAFAIADTMKEVMGVDKFESVVIGYSENFPDALAGSYLAAVADAPILLTKDKASRLDPVKDYINENLVSGGKVYILGSASVVPTSLENNLKKAGFDVQRLAGKDRYETNLEVLKVAMELDTDKTKPILVATGRDFADSLSASAAGMPVLLVRGNRTLSDAQKAFLEANTDRARYVIGSEGVVSISMYEAVGATKRLAGTDRYLTSVAVGNELVPNADSVVLAYASTFPDGLCGGPLAYQMGASLILTKARHEDVAADYVAENSITGGYVLGSDSLVTDDVVRTIFTLDADTAIGAK